MRTTAESRLAVHRHAGGIICIPSGNESGRSESASQGVEADSNARSHADGLALLVFEAGRLTGVFEIAMQDVVIGRSAASTICLHDQNVSRTHCIVRRHAGTVVLIDSGSTNGTYRRGKKIAYATLQDGDEILVGQALIKLVNLDARSDTPDVALFEQLHIDELTGLLNRRGFRAHIEGCKTLLPPGARLGLLLVSIDRLDWINATHGYNAATAIVARVGCLLRASIPARASAARLEAGDFGVLVIGIYRQQLLQLAQKVCDCMRTVLVEEHGAQIQCSISIGAAECVTPGDGLFALFPAAEDALLRAKSLQSSVSSEHAPASSRTA